MASTNRTAPDVTQQTTTSGNSRPAQPSGEGAEGWLRERVTGVLNARKSRLSERLDAVAQTVRRVGEPLREEPLAKLGGYADGAARTIERVATGLRDREVDELAEDVRTFARQRPAAFVGAGIAAGVIAARFLKSSGSQVTPQRPAHTQERARQGERGGRAPAGGDEARATAASRPRSRDRQS